MERAFAKHVGELVTASVVVHEMGFGIERMPRSRRRAELERFVAEIVAPLRVLPYGERAAKWHAIERARLSARGRVTALRDGARPMLTLCGLASERESAGSPIQPSSR